MNATTLGADFSSGTFLTILGVAAAILTTSSFVPQLIKAYRTKSLGDLSSYLMVMFASGTFLWMLYGVFKADPVIIAANAVSSGFNTTLLYLKFWYCRIQQKKTSV